ncbi:hypothetical protein BDR07DRAFT_1427220 [Suillus spraguei]|nr:hypothetical protein BDR07DRAFT_1427220 [Suillus spraguei]
MQNSKYHRAWDNMPYRTLERRNWPLILPPGAHSLQIPSRRFYPRRSLVDKSEHKI